MGGLEKIAEGRNVLFECVRGLFKALKVKKIAVGEGLLEMELCGESEAVLGVGLTVEQAVMCGVGAVATRVGAGARDTGGGD